MTDYWLSKMFFDLQNPQAAAEYRASRRKVIDRYPLTLEVKKALMNDDVPYLAKLVNPYLLRFYFFAAGMPDAEFIKRLRAVAPDRGEKAEAHRG
jgi:hypothetical protein